MGKFRTFAVDVLDAEYDTGASGTLALGPVSARVNYTLPIKAEFTTTLSTDTTPGTPFSGGSYPAGGISLAGLMSAAVAGSPSTKTNSGAVTATNMPAGTWQDVYTHDSTGTPKPMNFRGGSNLAKAVNAGDTCTVPASSWSGQEQ